jgi:hypothetical protein
LTGSKRYCEFRVVCKPTQRKARNSIFNLIDRSDIVDASAMFCVWPSGASAKRALTINRPDAEVRQAQGKLWREQRRHTFAGRKLHDLGIAVAFRGARGGRSPSAAAFGSC